MAFTPYATVTEFKNWVHLNDPVDDAVLTMLLATVTEWIDEYCDRRFWQDGVTGTEVARTFTASSSQVLDIDDLVSVTAFKTDEAGDGTYETTWAASDYQLSTRSTVPGRPYRRVLAVGTRRFPTATTTGRTDRVQITGIWGWPAVPRVVKMACLEQTNRELARANSPQGVAGFGEFGAVRVGMQLDPDVARNLGPVRRHQYLVA